MGILEIITIAQLLAVLFFVFIYAPTITKLLTFTNLKLRNMAKTFEEVQAALQQLQDSLDQKQADIAAAFEKLEKIITDYRNGGGANADQLEALSAKIAEVKADLVSTPVVEDNGGGEVPQS